MPFVFDDVCDSVFCDAVFENDFFEDDFFDIFSITRGSAGLREGLKPSPRNHWQKHNCPVSRAALY